MAAAPGKTPKKEKAKIQTKEERMAAVRYNHMMYGPTPGELKHVAKKVDFGAPYLKHPKFQSLMTAFKNGSNFEFSVMDKGKSYTIASDGAHILFDDKIIYHSRPQNKFERNLLLDKIVLLQYQMVEAFVHLVFAVIRSIPELGTPQLIFKNDKFSFGTDGSGVGSSDQDQSVMIGLYKASTGKAK